jgi:Ca-activated chloride channel homolog
MATALPDLNVSRRTCVSALLGAALVPRAFAQSQPPTPAWPFPRMQVRDAAQPVRLDRVDLRTEVLGHAVHSRIELVFFNPNGRVLEGELQFPLREGQWVAGFELDIDGELRPAVPVEKARGQQVFEDVTRARVDPALLEVTEGHHYKLRVYPLPPQGTRRVVLQIAESLDRSGRLVLPLRFADRLARLALSVQVAGVAPDQVGVALAGMAEQALQRAAWGQDGTRLDLQVDEARGTPELTLQLPRRETPLVATQHLAGQTYFYAELPVALRVAPRAAPRRVALLWDASGSGAKRDHGREFALLDAYFAQLGHAEVELKVGRDTVEPVQRFSVREGRWEPLRRVLQALAYDGASNLPALVDTRGADLALLVSDGLSNWGAATPLAPSAVPLYALADAEGADTARLRQLAERSGSEWLDLGALTPAQALQALRTRKPRLLGLSSTGARQLVAASPYASAGHIAFGGVLTSPEADVVLEFEAADGRLERRRVSVVAASGAGSTQAAQRWAALRLAELEGDHDEHRGEVRRLGKAFGLVSRETSLIVLDALADYVRFEIEPPASMRAAYERALAQAQQQRRVSRSQHLDRVAARFADQVAWWQQTFPKDLPPPPKPAQDEAVRQESAGAASGLGRQEMIANRLAPPAAAMPALAPGMAARAREAGDDAQRKSKADAPGQGQTATAIRLAPWAPDSAYARRLRAAPPEAVYQRYLDERPDHTNSTAFFLDAADVLFAKQRPALAMRVLSNLAEMDLQNRHVLRVLGYRLLQAKAPQLAVPVLRTVQRLSPNEPQSYRDLGLAHAEAGEDQAAVDQLWHVVANPWDGRFPDIDLTALAELNMVVARAERRRRPVDTRDIDRRLLRNLPLDLRITLAWDADNTDIDLWVTDPNGEKVYYGHRLSHQGGRISRDVTGGYGPEEFALRVAKPGRYVVQAQFYGHRQQVVAPATTLMLRLSTGFGRADQKDELVTLRLAGAAEMVTVGSFEVAG